LPGMVGPFCLAKPRQSLLSPYTVESHPSGARAMPSRRVIFLRSHRIRAGAKSSTFQQNAGAGSARCPCGDLGVIHARGDRQGWRACRDTRSIEARYLIQ
jgi:hypothetical protein